MLQQTSSAVNDKLEKTFDIILEPGKCGGPQNLKLIKLGEECDRLLHQL
jgi:hypothetical protein